MLDRVGIGWRPELAAGIFANLDRIGVVEVIADDYLNAPRRQLRALRFLARQAPVQVHSIVLGMASSEPVAEKRLNALARVVNEIEPEGWSEHLAFVRSAGIEIGHLAAPPRDPQSVESCARNIRKAAGIVGKVPAMENIATLIDPPCSSLPEESWISEIVNQSECGLLLDLHNLFANSLNQSRDAQELLLALPIESVEYVHIAGGKFVVHGGRRYLVDDHHHEVPQEVYDLLSILASRSRKPLSVILERDGSYPPFSFLLEEVERARAALMRGRQEQQLLARGASRAS